MISQCMNKLQTILIKITSYIQRVCSNELRTIPIYEIVRYHQVYHYISSISDPIIMILSILALQITIQQPVVFGFLCLLGIVMNAMRDQLDVTPVWAVSRTCFNLGYNYPLGCHMYGTNLFTFMVMIIYGMAFIIFVYNQPKCPIAAATGPDHDATSTGPGGCILLNAIFYIGYSLLSIIIYYELQMTLIYGIIFVMAHIIRLVIISRSLITKLIHAHLPIHPVICMAAGDPGFWLLLSQWIHRQ